MGDPSLGKPPRALRNHPPHPRVRRGVSQGPGGLTVKPRALASLFESDYLATLEANNEVKIILPTGIRAETGPPDHPPGPPWGGGAKDKQRHLACIGRPPAVSARAPGRPVTSTDSQASAQ